MKKTLALGGAAALVATIGLATPAQAAPPPAAGGSCVQAGIGTLKSLGLLQAAAQKQIDYSTLANAETGPIFADLPTGSYLSLGQVVKLHVKSPQLFAWCR
jgi:hypothetical protein